MRIRLRHIISALLLLAALGSAAQDAEREARKQAELLTHDPENTEALTSLMFHHLHKADYRKAIDYGERLLDIGYARQDYHRSVLYAHIGLGQAYTMLGDSITAYSHLGQARINGENARNDSALCSVYNGLGLYAYNLENDPYSALHYFFLGLDAAQRSKYERLRGILLANIASVYYVRRDTVGLKYSLQTYELGHRQNSPHLIYIGASTTAYMYFLQGKYEQTLDYVKEAEFLMQQNGFYDQGLVYAIYGMTVAELGDTRQAVKLSRKGLETAETNQPSTQVFLLYGYAHALGKEGRHDEAVTLLQQALALTDEKKHVLFQNLEHCMTDQGIYRDKLLTKEKVADLLGTNRTYLSQVINEQTGQTFTQYVNRYRLDEAIRLLGDPQADITLKGIASDVGFSSMTTFYKVF